MNAIVQFQAPRLPYHPVVEERFGVDKSAWKALVEAIYPAAKSVDSVIMALSYCKQRGLDPFKRPVHIVPVYDNNRKCMVETVWPGISELRTTAMRTSQYAGCDETVFGPDTTTKLSGVEVTFPEWAQSTVYRLVAGQRMPVAGPKTYWLESYATAKRDTEAPNTMWRKRPRGQLEKCAEAAALRRAFPEEIGNEYAAEEMEGRTIGPDGGPINSVDPAKTRTLHADFEAHDEVTGEIVEATVEEIDEALAGDRIPAEITEPGTHVMTGADLAARQAAEQEAAAQVQAVAGEQVEAATPPAPDIDPLDWAASFTRALDGMETEDEITEALAIPANIARFTELQGANPAVATELNRAIKARRAEIKGAQG